jgi:hypothetical protein
MSRLVDIRLVRDRNGTWRAKSGDAEPQVVAVSECEECPYWRDNEHYPSVCNHDDAPPRAFTYLKPPSWCPLRRGPAVVMLAEGDNAD